ncbi:NADH dehydrogenase [ubiquinone] 1 alpha subcomplex assembly factor 4 [Kryptolebias marmoratus]|uniref:NADH dehydrogenase [ubiquinone] 1 alpha subcomplex assembly factor 4 n=1 Tax=Kryptolebias marmoratus TaxID=37003 RepID=A0A3Q3A3L3_KRYMA|nr:NADH dehydrogenase [ubiquinone] 1 alpha subcomplex assembly factor 4 [Kryptolebias marmoratus]
MGARVSRMFRNYNIENRALREISREKLSAAPRHADRVPPSTSASSDVVDAVTQKNRELLDLLRTVYVESRDPAAGPAEASTEATVGTKLRRRPIKFSFPVNTFGITELTDVPKGKLTLAEALRVLGSHQHQPHTWTPEKIAQEYSLDLKDVKSALEFFIPFKIEVIPPSSRSAKQIKGS